MKHVTSYKLFETNNFNKELIKNWWKAFYQYNINILKNLISHGFDINTKDTDGETALLLSSIYGGQAYVKIQFLLLKQPNIDVSVLNSKGENFIDIKRKMYDITYLCNRDLQIQILENDRKDILVLFNKYGLVHPKIKEEYPELKTAFDLNLL